MTENTPRVHKLRRADVTDIDDGVHQVVLHFGFMDRPDVPKPWRTGWSVEL